MYFRKQRTRRNGSKWETHWSCSSQEIQKQERRLKSQTWRSLSTMTWETLWSVSRSAWPSKIGVGTKVFVTCITRSLTIRKAPTSKVFLNRWNSEWWNNLTQLSTCAIRCVRHKSWCMGKTGTDMARCLEATWCGRLLISHGLPQVCSARTSQVLLC